MADWTEELTDDHYLVTHQVDHKETGMRLDAFLKDRYRRRSRNQIQEAIELGAITVRRAVVTMGVGKKLRASTLLMAGDTVEVKSVKKTEPDVDFNYRILFEDEALFVIHKPPNLPVHPAGRFFFNTLLVHLRTHAFSNPLKAEREFFLPHRIDRETSGVLVLAKGREVCAHLVEQFASRTTQKRYLAIIHGHPTQDSFLCDEPLGRSLTSRLKLKMDHVPLNLGGQEASTQVRVMGKRWRISAQGSEPQPFALVECLPKTGRQHQIRIHLTLKGHPLVGDKIYGLSEEESLAFVDPPRRPSNLPKEVRLFLGRGGSETAVSAEVQAKLILNRHALHAAGIGFIHPISQQPMQFMTELPEDLAQFWEALSPTSVAAISENPAPLSL